MLKSAIIVGLMVALFAAPPATALETCTTKHAGSGEYLIYVDRVTHASSGTHEEYFLNRLGFAVETNVKVLQKKMLDDRSRTPDMPQVVVVTCDPKRAPHQRID